MTTFKATLEFLPFIVSYVREEMAKIGCSKDKSILFEIAVEEAVVNIIKHGYPDNPGTIEVSVSTNDDSLISLTLKDKGVPFNPCLYKTDFNPSVPLEKRSIGGSGLLLIKKISDKISYSREGSFNVLTLEKLIK